MITGNDNLPPGCTVKGIDLDNYVDDGIDMFDTFDYQGYSDNCRKTGKEKEKEKEYYLDELAENYRLKARKFQIPSHMEDGIVNYFAFLYSVIISLNVSCILIILLARYALVPAKAYPPLKFPLNALYNALIIQ